MDRLKIETGAQFNQIYHLLRSANSMTLEEWVKKYGYPSFPIYLEKAGMSYGFTTSPFGTWSDKEMDVVKFEP